MPVVSHQTVRKYSHIGAGLRTREEPLKLGELRGRFEQYQATCGSIYHVVDESTRRDSSSSWHGRELVSSVLMAMTMPTKKGYGPFLPSA
jgi:hypothetical protein